MDTPTPIQVDLGRIAQDLQIRRVQVESVVQLLDEGNTVPFITRYRKERTGNLNEVAVREVQLRVARLRELAERKETILKTIEAQGKLTDELRDAIRAADNSKRLEDLYLPYKPKKKTKASDARDKGLEPLALRIWVRDETLTDLAAAAQEFLNPEKELDTAEKVLEGVGHILAESISELAAVRDAVRRVVWKTGKIATTKGEVPEGQGLEFRDYFDYSEPVAHIPPHRVLAINRGDKEGPLKVKLDVSRPELERALFQQLPLEGHPQADSFAKAAVDALDRLLLPSMEREVRRDLTELAERHAVDVFARNLRSLLLQPPIHKQVVLAIDPGFRTGCKVAVLDAHGLLVEQAVIHPHPPQNRRFEAKQTLKDLVGKHHVDVVAIGNGTACRETEELVAEVIVEGTRFHQEALAGGAPPAEPTAAAPHPQPEAGATPREGQEGHAAPAEAHAAHEPTHPAEPAPAAEAGQAHEAAPVPAEAAAEIPTGPHQAQDGTEGSGNGAPAEVPAEALPPIAGGAPDDEDKPPATNPPAAGTVGGMFPEGTPPASAYNEGHDPDAPAQRADVLENSDGKRNPAREDQPDPDAPPPPVAGGAPDEGEKTDHEGTHHEGTPAEAPAETPIDTVPPPGAENPAPDHAAPAHPEPTGEHHAPAPPEPEAGAATVEAPIAESLAAHGQAQAHDAGAPAHELAAPAAPAEPAPPPAAEAGSAVDAPLAESAAGHAVAGTHEGEVAAEATGPAAPAPAGGQPGAKPAAAALLTMPPKGAPREGREPKEPREPREPRPPRPKQPPPPPRPHPADARVAKLAYVIVNEAGASVYSTSPVGREEFPDYDATTRGTVSIGRRLQDPLSELVKIEPQSIGVGLYQHDVNPKHLKESLETVIESCVNFVGVDLNSASVPLLRHVSGLNQLTARRIVDFRKEKGPFTGREQLKEVDGVGPATYTQAAGFLKVRESANPLDRTWIHPESYAVAGKLLERLGFGPDIILQRERMPELHQKLDEADLPALAHELETGEPTLRDIFDALARPERDPRDDLPKPIFKTGVLKLEDLTAGMELKGTVLNVVDFGAFVDIGLKDSGLVHISQLANRYIKSPHDVVSVGDVVTVWVMGVDGERKRVSLTMVKPGTERPRGGPGDRAERGDRGGDRRGGGPRPQGPAREGAPSGPGARPGFGPGGPRPGMGRVPGPPQRGQAGGGPGRGGPRFGPGGGGGNRYGSAPPPRPEPGPVMPPKPAKPAPPPPPLSKAALTGTVPLRSFGQLKQLWSAIVEGEPAEGQAGQAGQAPPEGTPPASRPPEDRPHDPGTTEGPPQAEPNPDPQPQSDQSGN